MIDISNVCRKDGCHEESSTTFVHLESDCHHGHKSHYKAKNKECYEQSHCHDHEENFEEAYVRPPIVPVAGGTVIIQTKANTTTVQTLNNAALIATLTIDIRPLSKHSKGNVVITTLGGVTLTSFSGTYGTTGTELIIPTSYLSLEWNGNAWVPAI